MAEQSGNKALPVTRVTLYTSGVGYFERAGKVEGDHTETLLFPVGQINDVLKSLIVLDRGAGEVRPVTYAAQDPVSKELKAFSVDIGDNPGLGLLLYRMRGAEATITVQGDAAAKHAGVILGIEEIQTVLPDRMGVTKRNIVNLLTADGLATFDLNAVTHVALDDKNLDNELRQALAVVAKGRDAAKRPLTLSFSGEGQRSVLVGYLTEAPAWQTAYRLVLAEVPMLQGWALVQNTSQEDWSDIRLSLVAGRPISFIQDLYSPLYIHRPTVKSRIPASPTPQAYAGEIESEGQDETLGDRPRALAGAAPRMASRTHMLGGGLPSLAGAGDDEDVEALSVARAAAMKVATSGAQLGQSHFAYQIEVPVSVPRQQSAMIPFLSAEIEAERVSIYNHAVCRDHPLAGARIKNTSGLHLMGGPITVFTEESGMDKGYVGDALIDDTEDGQSRLISFAIDLAVDAAAEGDKSRHEITSLAVAGGMARFVRRDIRETSYKFKNNAGDPRTIIVEHPVADSWQITSTPAPTERTADRWRFEFVVAPGESHKLHVVQESPIDTSMELAKFLTTAYFNRALFGHISAEMEQAFEEAARRRRAISQIEDQIRDNDVKLGSYSTSQERIRKNMERLDHASDLYRRYVADLDREENEIRDIQAEQSSLRAQLAQARTDLNEYLSSLDLQ